MKFFERERYVRSVEALTGESPIAAVMLGGRTKFTVPRHLVRTATRLLLLSPTFLGRGVRAVVDTLEPSDVTADEGAKWSAIRIRGRRWYVLSGYEPRIAKGDLRRVLAPNPPRQAESP